MPATFDNPHQVARLRRLAESIRAIRDGVDLIEASADSPDGQIRATVNGRGDLLDIDVSERVFRHPDSVGLAAAIVATVRSAQDSADREIAKISQQNLPAGLD
jgi:DNA-binding protein YbaB